MFRTASRGLAVLTVMTLLAACSSSNKSTTATVNTPGVSSTEILVGSHQPLTGPAASGYARISGATKAYFDYVNANGGVYGRKITYKVVDDGYDPSKTVSVVRQLVQQDKVFAILNGLGTPTHSTVLDFLNQNKVPDLFVASGSLSWNQPQKYPYTFGFNPDYTIEGKILANYAKNTYPGQKVCTYGQNDDFGTDGVKGVAQVLGDSGITDHEQYDVTVTNVVPAMTALQAKGCQVTIAFTIPPFTALAMGTAAKVGFHTQWLVSNVGSDRVTLTALLGPAAGLLEGMVTTGYLPATDDPTDPWVSAFKKINDQYNSSVPFDATVQYGYAVGYLFVEALLKAGKNLTRAGIISTIEKNGFVTPGVSTLRYSPSDHSGYGDLQMAKTSGGKQLPFGPVYTTDDGSGAISEVNAQAPTPPANTIPTA